MTTSQRVWVIAAIDGVMVKATGCACTLGSTNGADQFSGENERSRSVLETVEMRAEKKCGKT